MSWLEKDSLEELLANFFCAVKREKDEVTQRFRLTVNLILKLIGTWPIFEDVTLYFFAFSSLAGHAYWEIYSLERPGLTPARERTRPGGPAPSARATLRARAERAQILVNFPR